MYYIYEIKNLINGKTYIGQRKCPKNKTPETDIKYMGSGKILWKAYEKYGIDNFLKSIIETNIETKEEINKREIYWIAEYKKIGKAEYNIAKGGYGGGLLGRTCSEETKRKISEANKGKKHNIIISEELRLKFSESRRGEKNGFYGKHHSEETKKKISESQKGKNNYGKHFSEEHRIKISNALKGKKVSQETKDKLSKALLGRKRSEEVIKNFSEKMKGHITSDETRRKISEANKGKVKGRHWKLINGIRVWY